MKKALMIAVTALTSLCAMDAFAGGIENKANLSGSYLRNPSRNSDTKGADTSLYNVAGTAFMKNGLYVDIGNQFVIKEFKHTIKATGTSFNDETFVPFYPNVELTYSRDRWAAFANFSIHGGGGSLKYTEGTAPTSAALVALGGPQHEVDISSIVYGFQVGGAFAIAKFISVGAALRLDYGTQEMSLESDNMVFKGANGGDELGYNASAFGVSGVFGVHAKPISALDLSAQFSLRSKMNYEMDELEGNLAKALLTNDTFRNDLAPTLNLGVGYQVAEPVYLSASFNYYFNRYAKMNSALGENDYNDSFEVALGADADFTRFIGASLGISYANQGVTETSNNLFSPVLDSLMIGAGIEIRPLEDLEVALGISWVKYFDEDYGEGLTAITLSKPMFLFFSLGLSYRFDV